MSPETVLARLPSRPSPLRPSLVLCVAGLLLAGPAAARPPGDDGDRQQRRAELREQLAAERERWRAEGGRRGDAPPGSHAGAPGWGPPPGWSPAATYGGPPHGGPGGWGAPGYAPPGRPQGEPPVGWGGPGGGPGHPGAGRLSPDERRALRRELREHRR